MVSTILDFGVLLVQGWLRVILPAKLPIDAIVSACLSLDFGMSFMKKQFSHGASQNE